MTLHERFWSKVDRRGSDACWRWSASVDAKGYGRFMWREDRIPKVAHRIAWQLVNGEIPAGMLVCHRCDNPACCNPAHLFLGTAKDNTQDMLKKGRARGAAPKISDDAVRMIRQSTETGVALAKRLGIGHVQVSRIRRGLRRTAVV